MENVVRVLSTLALMGAVRSLAGRISGGTGGARIEADFAPTLALLERLRGGEAADIVILTQEGLDEVLRRRTVVAAELRRSGAFLCRHRGEGRRQRIPISRPRPRLRATLLGARSVAYSRIGASGIFFADLIERMGIASEINARATIVPQGFTAERLVTGEADLAVQQISELKLVAGIEVVGPIPLDLQTPAVFSAGRLAASQQAAAIRRAAEISGLAGGGAGAARVRAGALNLPVLRS